MREKFTTQLACGATDQLKTEIEHAASREGISVADYLRRAAIRDLQRQRTHEAADAA
jgi:hypothetical protein